MAHKILDDCTGCGACINVCPVSAITGGPGETHKINELRCVDCSVCGMSCPVGCVVDNDGNIVPMTPPENRAKPLLSKRLCALCMLCVDLCRIKAFHVQRPIPQGKMPSEVLYDETKCVGCGLCAKECPVNAITMVPPR
jgi:electron transport complex protein RnfB